MSFTPQLLAAARAAAPFLPKYRAGVVVDFERGQDAGAACTAEERVLLDALAAEYCAAARPSGYAKRLSLEHAVDYTRLLSTIARHRHRFGDRTSH